MKVISLGWGVQSFTMAAMVALGELPMVDAVIHADTTHERTATYEFEDRWSRWLVDRGINLVTVRADDTEPIGKYDDLQIPAFPKAEGEKRGIYRRQCTDDWKIAPLRRWLREQGGIKLGVELWIGISLDEFRRMRESGVQYIKNRWPLIEKKMTRADCIAWLKSHGLEVPSKSSCIFCPMHTYDYWLDLKQNGNGDWDRVVEFDELIRDMHPPDKIYLTQNCKPIKQVANELGLQMSFEDECSGFCFV